MRAAALLTTIFVALAGCVFDHQGVDDQGGDQPGVDAAVVTDADPPPPDAREIPPVDAMPARKPCPPDPDLRACYAFEAQLQPAQPFDDSGQGNHGTAMNVTYVAGHDGSGEAMRFDQASDVRIPEAMSLDIPAQITIEAWILVDALPDPDDQTRAGLIDNNGQYGLFLTPTGAIRCIIPPVTASGLAIPVGAWTHVACVYDGQAITLYQGGLPGAVTATSVPINTGNTQGLTLGIDNPSGDHFEGALDEARIWARALPAEAICATAGCTPPPMP